MNQNVTEPILDEDDETPDAVPVPGALVPHLSECVLLLDIDGTLLDLAPTPREVWVPPDLANTLPRLMTRSGGAVGLGRGRSATDIDLIFAPRHFPAGGGHGAEMRLSPENEAVSSRAPPMDRELKR